jgi:ubiquinone/menaquinone biosynthesis C-methylase UbiE
MTNWSDGYIADVTYTSGFYRELTPAWITTTAYFIGRFVPDMESAFNYCELGCGQGFGANLIAATHPQGRFWAVDFNPAQIINARRMAQKAGLQNIEFVESSFQQVADAPADAFPQFDYIVLHGIYSWVSRDNQKAIARFVGRFLKPGGVVYNSYNCQPGWAAFTPLQKLMRLHADRHPGSSDQQAHEALQFAQKLIDSGSLYTVSNPIVKVRVEKALEQNKHYLAHEYMHQQWDIHHFADVMADFAEAKCNWMGSAHLPENIDVLSAPASMHALINEAPDDLFRETLKDFAHNQSFRRDLYVRGVESMTVSTQKHFLYDHRFTALLQAPEGEFKFSTPIGEVTGKEELYRPLLEALYGVSLSFRECLELPAFQGRNTNELVQALMLLISGGFVHACFPGRDGEAAQNLNRIIAQQALLGDELSFLAAPGLGSAVAANLIEMQIAAILIETPETSLEALADGVWQRISSHGRALVKDGVALQGADANRQEVAALITQFMEKKEPFWRLAGVI